MSSKASTKERTCHAVHTFVLGFAIGCILVSGSCGEVNSPADEGTVEETWHALTPTQPSVRPTIYAFTPTQRTTLVNGILAFITQPILDQHALGHDWHHPSVGELFFIRHHEYLNQLENYLLGNGLGQFVPVPEWTPGTPIPGEFMVADPLVTQAPMTQTINQPVPAAFADDKLCNFPNAGVLAQSVEPWHDSVHGLIGGAMGNIASAPGAPIFWLWHGLLDDMYHERTWRCETIPAVLVAINLPL